MINEDNFTTEKEICDTDTTDSEWEEADDRNAFGIFDEQRLFPILFKFVCMQFGIVCSLMIHT